MSGRESASQELFSSKETADQTPQVSFQETAVHQEEQEPAQEQGELVPEDQNVFQETPDEEQSDIALVENAYLYLTKGAYPDGATKNEKEVSDERQNG